ncbi:MAG: serine hydrolase [Candidatus Latescibacteria bacterium]|nr:serine hydrolase [Candidatus Latescibacterota bacterium]
MNITFPAHAWEMAAPEQVGMNPAKLVVARQRLDTLVPDKPYRVAIVRDGYLVVEWLRDLAADDPIHIASAMKSVLSNMLGIAVAEGRIGAADEGAVEHFPEMMDVPPGRGPKEGRYAFDTNQGATLRHLICNVSGYLKPGEEPGKVFNYQTTGMCLLTHCIERAYGRYDVEDPEGSAKIGGLFKEKIADRIGPPGRTVPDRNAWRLMHGWKSLDGGPASPRRCEIMREWDGSGAMAGGGAQSRSCRRTGCSNRCV